MLKYMIKNAKLRKMVEKIIHPKVIALFEKPYDKLAEKSKYADGIRKKELEVEMKKCKQGLYGLVKDTARRINMPSPSIEQIKAFARKEK